MCAQVYSSKLVEAGSARLTVIGGDLWASAQALWAAAQLLDPIRFSFDLEAPRTF